MSTRMGAFTSCVLALIRNAGVDPASFQRLSRS
jgi:hypothetical protein